MRRSISISNLIIMAILICCVEPFPVESINFESMLVVDGLLTTDPSSTKIILSRTANLTDVKFLPEQNANVTIVDSKGISLSLSESEPGVYRNFGAAGSVGETYRLHITTDEGNEFISSEVKLKDVPPIDNIYAKYEDDLPNGETGIQVYIDSDATGYEVEAFKWDYVETYEIHAPFPSSFVWLGGNDVVFRDQRIDICWASDTSRNVIVYNASVHSQNKIEGFPIRFLDNSSYAMRITYSILVRQQALSDESYLFWETLRKTTETQGSLYDVQPGAIQGNVTSVNNKDERVLGYFEASRVSERRATFRSYEFFAEGYRPPGFLTSCRDLIPDQVPQFQIGAYMEKFFDRMVISEAAGTTPNTIFECRPIKCCDCTNLGTNIKPSFWP